MTTLSGGAGEVDGTIVQRRRGRKIALGIGLGATALASALGVTALRGSGAPPPPAASAPAPPPAAPAAIVAAKPEGPVKAKVVVRSVPPGAQIIVDDQVVSVTPALLSLTLPTQIDLLLDGYKPAREVVTDPGEVTIKLVSTRAPATKPAPPKAAPAAKKPAVTADDETLD